MIFKSNMFVYLLAYLFLPVLILYKAKIQRFKSYNYQLLDKNFSDGIKGVVIFLIIFHHLSLSMTYPSLMSPFKSVGYLAVSLFFFYSGYGLMSSKLKSIFLPLYWKRRLSKVFLPFIFINILTLILFNSIFKTDYTPIEIIYYILGIKLIDSVMWYIISTMFFYFIFYILFKNFKIDIAIKLLFAYSFIYFIFCYLIGLDRYWFNTSFCFPVGVFIALYKEKFFYYMKEKFIIISSLSFISLALTIIISLPFKTTHPLIYVILVSLSSISFIFSVLSFLFKVKIENKFIIYVGSISYEMYLTHNKIITIYTEFKINSSYSVCFYITIVILLSICLHKFFNSKILFNTSKQNNINIH